MVHWDSVVTQNSKSNPTYGVCWIWDPVSLRCSCLNQTKHSDWRTLVDCGCIFISGPKWPTFKVHFNMFVIDAILHYTVMLEWYQQAILSMCKQTSILHQRFCDSCLCRNKKIKRILELQRLSMPNIFIVFSWLLYERKLQKSLRWMKIPLTLIWVGVGLPSSCWFSLNNSETLKAVTLAFCSIQWHFIRDIRSKFHISSLLILGKTQMVFLISGFLVNPL